MGLLSAYQLAHLGGVSMGTTAVIGLGIVAWVLTSVLVAIGAARMIRLRDRQRPERTEPEASIQGGAAQGRVAGSAEQIRTPPRCRLRNKS